MPAWRWLAEIALAEKNYDESADLVGKMLARDSINYDALLLMVDSIWREETRTGRLESSRRQWRRIRRRPEYIYELAIAYLAKNEVGQAVSV